nr:MAG TPA: Putative head tail adaptor [Caudoviricetes sp.]
MNKKIEIIAMDFTRDELNQEIRKEVVVAKVWAKVRLMQSSENTKNYKNEGSHEMQFEIRYRKEIDKTMKIRYRGELYCIDYVENENEADKFLILHAKAIEEGDTNVNRNRF